MLSVLKKNNYLYPPHKKETTLYVEGRLVAG